MNDLHRALSKSLSTEQTKTARKLQEKETLQRWRENQTKAEGKKTGRAYEGRALAASARKGGPQTKTMASAARSHKESYIALRLTELHSEKLFDPFPYMELGHG